MGTVGMRAVTGSYDETKGVLAEGYVPTLFAWKNSTAIIYTKVEAPTTSDKALVGASTGISEETITAIGASDPTITVDSVVYARYSDGDVAIN